MVHLVIRDANALLVLFRVKGGTDFETGGSFGSPDKFQSRFVIGQRMGRPVVADKAKHAVLDGVPF